MKREEILRLFKSLSKSNGYYGRLLADLNELSQNSLKRLTIKKEF